MAGTSSHEPGRRRGASLAPHQGLLLEHGTSSPATASSDGGDGSRPRKPPSVTPRTFRRFFTPRSSLTGSGGFSSARRALRDITTPATNRGGDGPNRQPASLGPFSDINIAGDENASGSVGGAGKSGGTLLSPETSPDASPSLKRRRIKHPTLILEDGARDELPSSPLGRSLEHKEIPGPARRVRRGEVTRFGASSVSARILQRSMGDFRDRGASHCADWQHETVNFYSGPTDVHLCSTIAQPVRVPPFCTASCNTNTLVAVGDEKGCVRLLESARDGKPGFQDAYLAFQPHENAILDLTFSSDDLLLATASGDQTTRIIDMPTRRVISTLPGHTASVKQVQFQPGDAQNSIIATSGRDGSVQIWDLRCKGAEGPVRRLNVSLDSDADGGDGRVARQMTWARPVNSIFDAHPERRPQSNVPAPSSRTGPSIEASSRSESPGSVTALAFLPPGREHLLLTASEGNACIKLWDLRTTHTHRRGRAVPLSTTRQPESHDKYRHFGINALALGGDSGRLYSLCRDNTVYAYSTSHLILGHAPELYQPGGRPRRSGGSGKEGLGPIYGFRHPQLHTATFYVKLSLRRAAGDKSEVLAAGSSDGCAVVFPTDESYLVKSQYKPSSSGCDPAFSAPLTPQTPRPGLKRSSSGVALSSRLVDTIPMHQHGSALIRGHGREVTGVSWTSEGELITVGDDFLVRCWREGPEARQLRRGGEREGRRWGCGWADAKDSEADEE